MTNILHQKRAARIRRKLKRISTERFRLTVFRSSRNISAQIIDDLNNKTLVSASSIKEKIDTKKLAGKFFNIVRIGLDKYAEEKQKELNNKRWSRVSHTFKTINTY